MNGTLPTAPNRTTVVHTLAVVGFIALVGAGIGLAVYSARFVPAAATRFGAAAVYLGSVFTPAPEPSLSVVPTPTASTTIPFGEESPAAAANTAAQPAPTPAKQTAPTAGQKTTSTYPAGGPVATTNTLAGLPDLIVLVKAIGYLTSASADSFVASSTVPSGLRPAVNFTIKNIGTNATGPWCFSASIPTSSISLYESAPQQNLNPGDYIDYTLGFDQANRGTDQTISVTANIADTANAATCARVVTESNSNNNTASAKITIIGG